MTQNSLKKQNNENIYKFNCIINSSFVIFMYAVLFMLIIYSAYMYNSGIIEIIKAVVFAAFLLLIPYLIFLFNFYRNIIYKIIRNEDNLTLIKFQNLQKIFFNFNLIDISQITAKLLDNSYDILEICLYSGENYIYKIPKIQDRENFEKFFEGISFKYQLTNENDNETACEQNTNKKVFETRQRNFCAEILVIGLIVYVIIFFELNKIMDIDFTPIIILFIIMSFISILLIFNTPVQKLTKENNLLILEKQIILKKIYKVFNIDEIKEIKISVEDYAIRKFENEFYLTLRFFIELKNGNSHRFSFNIHRLEVSNFLIKAIIFFKDTKISLSEFPGYMKHEIENFIEPLLKDNNTINDIENK